LWSIVVLYNQVEAVLSGEPFDILADQEAAQVAQEISSGLQSLGYRTACVGVAGDVAGALAAFSPDDWLVFNLCEGLNGDPALEARVPPALEGLGFTHTGASGPGLAACLDKAHTKERLQAHGLPTPRYAVLSSPGERCDVPLPAMVKPLAEDGSLGISWESVVCEPGALAGRVRYVVERYEQPALVEEFIDGREFNLAVWGNSPPEPLPTAEIDYQSIGDPLRRVCTYEAKWVEDSFAYHRTPVVCPAQVDAGLGEQLCQAGLAAYRLMGCRDYARIDMRERQGSAYILEVNPNPSLAADAGFYRAARALGYDHARMAEQIVRFALERTASRGDAWEGQCSLHRRKLRPERSSI
jgi:D-alanine-D-alanine ligase